jgi:hypothetical protein
MNKTHSLIEFELERSTYNMSFNELNTKTGNLSDLIIDKIMVEETIHEQYRNKKKVIEIKVKNNNELV